MPILVFLVDTSASMNQRTYVGTTLLDVAKGAVETFMKLRARDPASRGDRYMLASYDDPPATIKAGWKENHATFMNELKNLQANSLSGLGPALKQTFDLLNVNRLHSGIDNYGQGRNPFFLEPAMIITLTDGNKLTSLTGTYEELHLPMHSSPPGSELTKEPFRWDQRLFSIVLRMPAAPSPYLDRNANQQLPWAEDCPVNAMCDVTGGRSYVVNCVKQLNQCLESLTQKVQSGVVLHFELFGSEPAPVNQEGKTTPVANNLDRKSPIVMETDKPVNGPLSENNNLENNRNKDEVPGKNSVLTNHSGNNIRNTSPTTAASAAWQSSHKLIYVRPNPKTGVPMGHWPIPESFWPDATAPTLPPRDAHPIVRFVCTDCEPMILENLPFDKYELEPSPLTQFILERKAPQLCWQVFVSNSCKYSDLGYPFGYLKASVSLTCVNLFVLPYNYPVLISLLDELFKVHKLKPSAKWRQTFDIYLKTVPSYYAGSLRTALRRMGTPNLIPDNVENCIGYSVVSHLKKLKQQSRIEADRLAVQISSIKNKGQEGAVKVIPRSPLPSLAKQRDFQQLLQNFTGETIALKQDHNVNEFPNFTLALNNKDIKPQSFRNPFDIPRKDILDQIFRMRTNFLRTSATTQPRFQDEDQSHSIPVAEMGNYQEYLKRMPAPLRDADPAPARLHTFGNPFKLDDKNKKMMVDEADVNEAMTGPQVRNKRQMDTPPGSPAPKRQRSMSPSPPSRRPPPNMPPNSPTNQYFRRSPSPMPLGKPPSTSQQIAMQQNKDMKKLENSKLIKNEEDLHNVREILSLASQQQKQLQEAEEDMDVQIVNHSNGAEDEPITQTLTKKPSVDNVRGEEPITESVTVTGKSLTNNVEPKRKESKIVVTDPRTIIENNLKLRDEIVKVIRRPGKNHAIIFEHLSSVCGDAQIKYMFINEVIREATRFKRKSLIQHLQLYQQSINKSNRTMSRQNSVLPHHSRR